MPLLLKPLTRNSTQYVRPVSVLPQQPWEWGFVVPQLLSQTTHLPRAPVPAWVAGNRQCGSQKCGQGSWIHFAVDWGWKQHYCLPLADRCLKGSSDCCSHLGKPNRKKDFSVNWNQKQHCRCICKIITGTKLRFSNGWISKTYNPLPQSV